MVKQPNAAILALLARAQAQRAAKDEAKAAAKLAKAANPAGKENNAIAKRILDEALWRPVSRVTIFQNQNCQCCGETTRYIWGFMAKQVWFTNHTTIRMVAAKFNDGIYDHLPMETVEYHHETPVCAKCIEVVKDKTLTDLVHTAGMAAEEQLPLFN